MINEEELESLRLQVMEAKDEARELRHSAELWKADAEDALARVAELEAELQFVVDECDEMGKESCRNPHHAEARRLLNR